MGQSRTALVIGIIPDEALHNLLTSDKAEIIMDHGDAPSWHDSGLFGIAFACAYDDSDGEMERVRAGGQQGVQACAAATDHLPG